METTMGAIVARAHSRFVGRPALLEPGRVLSFAELGAQVRRVAAALAAAGARHGDRIVLWLENSAEFLEVEQACFLSGYVRTALSPRLHPSEVAHIIENCSPAVLVTSVERAAALHELQGGSIGPQVLTVGGSLPGTSEYATVVAATPPQPPAARAPREDDVAALLYTSGTTGRPKAAVLTHRNWVAMVSGLLMELPALDDTDVVLHSGPMGHLSGSVGTACYARGAATVMLRKFDAAAVLEAVSAFGVTVLPLVPTMLSALVDAAEGGIYDLSTLRAIPYGGSAASPELLRRAQSVFGDVLVQVYGLSEALVPLTALSPAAHRAASGSDPAPHLSSAGRPSPFVDVRVLTDDGTQADPGQPGEIVVRGDTVMAGYWAQPEATSEVMTPDGWLRTGDVGYLARDGYLYLVDRKRDLIVTGGYNVYPAEVERIIQTLPEVHEVVVVGAPHERWGETVTAVIALKAGAQLTEDRIVEVCREHLAGYKKPTAVHFVVDLPKNSSGKLLRREVRERFWAGRERSVGA